MPIKGKTKVLITWEDVLKNTNGGWDVFSSEIRGLKVGKPFKNPLRKDTHPSMSVMKKDSIWLLKDWSTGEVYTPLKFIQQRYRLGFKEAIEKMASDAGLMEGSSRMYISVEVPIYKPNLEELISITYWKAPWGKKAKEYWRNTGVTEAHCVKHNVFPVKEAAIKNTKEYIGKNELVWAYDGGGGKVKLYFPERPKGERFKNNIKGSYLWNFENIQKCDKLIVQKSVKDLLVTTLFTPCVIATQHEESAIFTEELVEEIHTLSPTIYVAYGSDEQGVREGTKLSQKYKWKHINPPKKLLPEINDFYGLAKKFGLTAVEKLLKSKGIL